MLNEYIFRLTWVSQQYFSGLYLMEIELTLKIFPLRNGSNGADQAKICLSPEITCRGEFIFVLRNGAHFREKLHSLDLLVLLDQTKSTNEEKAGVF